MNPVDQQTKGSSNLRQIVLDTETTGLAPEQGHRVIEIGCVELLERRPTGNDFHQYLQPHREIDAGAIEVHGITNEFLEDKPGFEDIAEDFIDYIRGAELIIHNAPFDVGFLNAELARLDKGQDIASHCGVIDTLVMARGMHPGQRNSLDALCGRYDIDNSQRQKHGALLDAEILAEVYLAMTGGQVTLSLDDQSEKKESGQALEIKRLSPGRPALPVIGATGEESAAHEQCIQSVDEASGGQCVWLRAGVES